jgi:hypothetical protein
LSVKTKAQRLALLARGDSYTRYVVADRVAKKIQPDAQLGEYGKNWLHDRDFFDAYLAKYDDGATRRLERLYLVDQFAKYALTVDGDTAECGVWFGATSYMILRRSEGSDKTHHMFDSWEGLPTPGAMDGEHFQEPGRGAGYLAAPEQKVRATMAEFDRARFYKGWIPERFAEVADRRFALVHSDVDLYEPTMATLEFFYPRLSDRGVLICDDSGLAKCPGARQAMDEFFATKPEPLIELPTGQTLVIKRD